MILLYVIQVNSEDWLVNYFISQLRDLTLLFLLVILVNSFLHHSSLTMSQVSNFLTISSRLREESSYIKGMLPFSCMPSVTPIGLTVHRPENPYLVIVFYLVLLLSLGNPRNRQQYHALLLSLNTGRWPHVFVNYSGCIIFCMIYRYN